MNDMYYIAYKGYKGKNLIGEDVEVPVFSRLVRIGSEIYFEGKPLCIWRSRLAKDFLIWDDNFEERLSLENIILWQDRQRYWTVMTPVTDENGKNLGSKAITVRGRFLPEEASYIKVHFPQLVKSEEVLNFNDYFYTGSSIAELRSLAEYMQSVK